MLHPFQNHISQAFPFLKGKRVLLAISGGIDSMVLLALFRQLPNDIAVAHCNFQLRGTESDGDEAFVREQVAQLHVPLFVQKFDTKKFSEDEKLSTQLAARKLRYAWFSELLEQHGYDYLLTAHHLDDSLETFLINFSRGSGLDGLTGIPAQNEMIVRPMLVFSRETIERYALENAILWREDSSNASDNYLRNKIRHHVIPVLKELNSGFLHSFQNTLSHLQQAESLVDDASRLVYRIVVENLEDQKRINLEELLKLPNYSAYLYRWLQPFGFTAWKDIYDLVYATSGKQVFSETHVVLKDRIHLIVYPKKTADISEEYWIPKDQRQVNIPLNLSLCAISDISHRSGNCIFVDEDKLIYPLQLRKWQEGDSFFPFGMTGKKKVSKFLKNEKASLLDKSNIWLLCSEDKIVWIVGKRQDDRFKTDKNTTRILQIKLEDNTVRNT
jgi:tRNA(Ile)-lysidine synthase